MCVVCSDWNHSFTLVVTGVCSVWGEGGGSVLVRMEGIHLLATSFCFVL